MEEKEIERISLLDLDKIVRTAKRYCVKIAIIGGYAVRAYTEGYRYTKDIDMVIVQEGLNRITSLLSQLKYRCKRTGFGLRGLKKINDDFIDLHISIDRVFDASTNQSYPATMALFRKAKTLKASGYYEENRKMSVKIPVISLEELLLLKLMTEGRDKDTTDIVSLLIDQAKSVNLKNLLTQVGQAKLAGHFIHRISSVLVDVREGLVKKTWEGMTGSRLQWKQEREIVRFMKELYQKLRTERR
ncbi:MAG: hypothetical protein HY762_08780 [Planctomycetes bacterium]|nr:hypothetical protein [Planctomycetota bacterium]